MKEIDNLLSTLVAGIVCLVACLSFSPTNPGREKEKKPSQAVAATETATEASINMTVSPEVPLQVTFCGATVDLRRYNMYEGMDRELSGFTYYHSSTLTLFKRANRYFPVIEPILEQYGIPNDFKYLAVIESSLDPRATSSAKAAGMWQFMESTAKSYELIVTSTVDERFHVRRSTEAACLYLKESYAKYGDWVAVAASYNAGMGRISSEYTRQNITSTLDLWLVEETSRYVYRILAIKQIFENPSRYGFFLRAKDLYKPVPCDEVIVSRDVPDLIAFAGARGITYADLKRFNPWLRDSRLNVAGKSVEILIPRTEYLYYNTPNRTVHDPRWVIAD